MTVDPVDDLPYIALDNYAVYKLATIGGSTWNLISGISAIDIAAGLGGVFAWVSNEFASATNTADYKIYMRITSAGVTQTYLIGLGVRVDVYDSQNAIYTNSFGEAFIIDPANVSLGV